MTLVTNSFDGVTPSGTALTQGVGGNTGGTSGSFFDTIFGPPASDNTHVHGGSGLSMMVNTTAAAAYAQWTNATFTSVPGALNWRAYLWMAALPGAACQLITCRTTTATAGFVNVTTTGTLQLKNAASGTVFTSTALATSTWHRIEGLVTGGTTGSDGQLQLQVFSGANSEGSTADQDSTLLTAQNCGTTGTANNLRIGTSSAITVTLWLDDLGGSTTGFLGPSGSGPVSPNAGVAAGTGVPPGPAASNGIHMTIQGI